MATFNEVWSQIYHHLSKGMQIRNWSREGYTDNVTTIHDVFFQEICLIGEQGTAPRWVSRDEFRRVFECWDRYKQGFIDRAALETEARTQNTTYIFSVLHWLEQLPTEQVTRVA